MKKQIVNFFILLSRGWIICPRTHLTLTLRNTPFVRRVEFKVSTLRAPTLMDTVGPLVADTRRSHWSHVFVSSLCCVYSKLTDPVCCLMSRFNGICGKQRRSQLEFSDYVGLQWLWGSQPWHIVLCITVLVKLARLLNAQETMACVVHVQIKDCPLWLLPPQVLLHTVWIQEPCAVSQWRNFVGRSGKKACKLTKPSKTCLSLKQTHSTNNTAVI